MASLRRIPLTYNNVYEISGPDDRVLIDTGPDYAGAREALLEALSGPPALVIATHGHSDHAGLGRWWQERGVPVAAGVADVHLTAHPHMVQRAELDAMRDYLRQTGAPEDVRDEAMAGLERRRSWALRAAESPDYPPATSSTRWPTALRYESFEPQEVLSGDREMLGLQALSCPGHTPGNLVVVHLGEGWLFSGDQLLPDITPTPGLQFVPGEGGFARFRSLPAFAASLARLRGKGFARCFPGHGEPFEGVDQRIEANLSAIEERNERVLAELRANGPGTAFAIAERLYPRAVRRRFWQIVATVQGHLDMLEERALVCATNGMYETNL